MELGLRSLAAAGASAVITCLNSPSGRFVFGSPAQDGGAAGGAAQAGGGAAPAGTSAGGGDAAFEAFLGGVAEAGVPPLQMAQFSAHQMGTCRLGAQAALAELSRPPAATGEVVCREELPSQRRRSAVVLISALSFTALPAADPATSALNHRSRSAEPCLHTTCQQLSPPTPAAALPAPRPLQAPTPPPQRSTLLGSAGRSLACTAQTARPSPPPPASIP